MTKNHPVLAECFNKRCAMCDNEATHKVEEVYYSLTRATDRRPFAAYVCCTCFGVIFGSVAAEWCMGTGGRNLMRAIFSGESDGLTVGELKIELGMKEIEE